MCEGPLIWYEYEIAETCEVGAVLHCARCGHLTTTGNWHEPRHAHTPVLREGLG